MSTFLQTGNHSWSCRTSILEGATFHKMSYCKFLWVILARPSRHSTTGTSSPGTSGSRCISVTLLHERIRRRIRLCHFSTLIDIVAETAIVSSRTLPVGFPLSTISKNSLYTLFCSLILEHIIFVSGPKFFIRKFCSILRFTLSSICDNQVPISSDESPGHTIPIRS